MQTSGGGRTAGAKALGGVGCGYEMSSPGVMSDGDGG